MGATVTHLPSFVTYFQVSVVDHVLVFEPREPPVRQTKTLHENSNMDFLHQKLSISLLLLKIF